MVTEVGGSSGLADSLVVENRFTNKASNIRFRSSADMDATLIKVVNVSKAPYPTSKSSSRSRACCRTWWSRCDPPRLRSVSLAAVHPGSEEVPGAAAAKACATLGLAVAQENDARHVFFSETSASANVAMSLCSVHARRSSGTVTAAPLPSPRRMPRSSSGRASSA